MLQAVQTPIREPLLDLFAPFDSRRRVRSIRRLATAVVCVLAGSGAILSAGDDRPDAQALRRGWQAESQLQFAKAREIFDSAGQSRQATLGKALALLNIQPKTRGNVNASAGMLEKLLSENPDDAIGIAAAYWLGRVDQLHRYEPDPGRAADRFERLFDRHRQSYLGQMALVKAALIRLYDPADRSDRGEMIDRWAARGRALTHADAVRDFHLLLADAAGRFDLPPEVALEHLQAVDAVGVRSRKTRSDLLVRIAEYARRAGQAELAIASYARFLEAFPLDHRAYTVARRRDRLAGSSTTRPAAAPAGAGHD